MRAFYPAIALLCGACVASHPPPPGTLLLGNSQSGDVAVEAVVTANPDCNARDGGYVGTSRFSLPPQGTRFIGAPPGASVCWRAGGEGGRSAAAPVPWNRTYLSPGAFVGATL